ncbi:MAG: hypothetical protein ACC656_01485 [Candidatus Heimdallarchaeota archaeon]
MAQINLKLTNDEYDLLQYYAEKSNIPTSTALKSIIKEYFDQWKIDYLLKEYCSGRLGFKKAWKMSGLQFNEWLLTLEKSDLELELPEIIEKKSEEIAKGLSLGNFRKNQP